MKRYTLWMALPVLLLVAVAACKPVGDAIGIGDRDPPTVTPRTLLNATPGGELSVWLVTPTGQAGDAPQPVVQGTLQGNPVEPNATATANAQARLAATATARATPQAPYRPPAQCPALAAPPRPRQPEDFRNYSETIGTYLSQGVSTTVLEATLADWGAIRSGEGGLVQADSDLTGDGVPEVIVTLYNPTVYNPDAARNVGQLLVYSCHSGGYRLIYSTEANPDLRVALPRLLRVGDMNADVSTELVFYTETCDGASCYKQACVLSWNMLLDRFQELNSGQIVAINGRIGITDLDGDGVLEITAQVNQPGTAAAGPPRSTLDTWDWDGTAYRLALREEEAVRYRIHAVYEADDLLRDNEFSAAITAYANLRDNNDLQTWAYVPNEVPVLRAYAAFRIMIAYARVGNTGRAESWFTLLQNENPPGSPGHGFAQMGTAFMENYRTTGSARQACAPAINVGAAQANVLGVLNSYGYANRSYTPGDLCPF